MRFQFVRSIPWLVTVLSLTVGGQTDCLYGQAPGNEREAKVRNDQARILKEGFWIYNNLPKGLEQAKESGKPVLVIFRCLPCEACAQLDASVIEDNPQVRKWLSQFVPVRIVHANGMDMNKFQFDYDQSWAAFVLHADGTIIGRYGTRSHETKSEDDVSLAGFMESLGVALSLHRDFDKYREQLKAKSGPPAPVERPELFPKLKEKYGSKLDYEGKVVASCIHCHQVGDELLAWNRERNQLTPEVIFRYPNPKILGLVMDPAHARTIQEVPAGSPAAAAGLKAGDQILRCENQPIISTADIQWVLHHVGSKSQLALEVQRGDEKIQTTLKLPNDWRAKDDIAWRVSSWAMRRAYMGGLKLESLDQEKRQELKLPEQAIGLHVKHMGQFAPHDVAKRAGFKVGDVILEYGQWHQPMTEGDLLAKLMLTAKAGEKFTVKVQRGERTLSIELPVMP